jgi:Protein of unknown function (DUF2934)
MSQRISERQVTNEPVRNELRNMVHASLSASEVRELIARRAYELYRHRGAEFGDELSDWLAAEGEVVTMLLAEPQETGKTKNPNGRSATRTADSQCTAKPAGATRQRVTRRPKRNITLTDNPA